MDSRTYRIQGLIVLILVFLMAWPLLAAPYFNREHVFIQPDGTEITLILNGDEYYMRAETLDGFTVVRDEKTGWLCYAELNADGTDFVSTGVAVDSTVTISAESSAGEKMISANKSVKKSLKIKASSRLKKIKAKQKQLFGDDMVVVNGLAYPADEVPDTNVVSSLDDAGRGDVTTADADTLPSMNEPVSRYNQTIHGLVLIFEFSDARASHTLTEYYDKVNKPNFYYSNGNAASLRTFYEDVSGGTFIMDNYVYGIFMAPQTFAYYDSLNYGEGAHQLLSIALNQMEADGFDFSQLTTDDSGMIKSLCVSYTGSPKAWAEGMWYHAGGWGGFSADGVHTGSYCTDNAGLNPGTMIHENGHMAAGWPDTYSYVGGEPGTWGVMGGGYCDLPNPYFLYRNGWVDAINIKDMPGQYTMNSADPHSLYFYYDPAQPTEFFIMRPYTRGLLFCPDIPDEGMTFWRINTQGDNANYPNSDRRVEMIHASNDDGNKTSNVCFKAGGILDHYTSTTAPSTDWEFGTKAGQVSGMEITNISAVGGEMSFILGSIPEPVPYFPFNGSFIDASGNGIVATGYNFTGLSWSNNVSIRAKHDLDRSINFDGVDDYVECASTVAAYDSLTVACWFRPDEYKEMVLLDKFPSDATAAGWRIKLQADGRIQFAVGSISNNTIVVTEQVAYEPLNWNHVMCAFGDGMAAIYVNGTLRGYMTNIPQTPDTTDAVLRMGAASQVETTLLYDGLLDDVRFYDSALNAVAFDKMEGLQFKPDPAALLVLDMDEIIGTVAHDSSGMGNDATLVNGLSFSDNSVPGKCDGALEFDGVDDYIDLPSSFKEYNDGLTFAMWVYPTAVQGWSRFFDFGNGPGSDNILLARQSTSNNLIFDCYIGNSTINVVANDVIELNKWQFFAVVVTNDGQATIYKNHKVVKTGSARIPPQIYRKNCYIGKSNWSADTYFKGMMDDIRIFNYALNDDAVLDIYNQRHIGGSVPFNGQTMVDAASPLTFTPAIKGIAHNVYFGQSYQAVKNATQSSDEFIGTMRYAQFDPTLSPRAEYYWRVDELTTDGAVIKGPVWRFTTGGKIKLERWTGLGNANEVSVLTSQGNYPNYPSQVNYLDNIDIPRDFADGYGSRVQALLVPPATGNYTFWISGDDEVELWISTTESPDNAALRAYIHNGWSNYQSYDQIGSQRSSAIYMQAGKKYYMMALHKEGGGGDHMSVAWRGPGIPNREVIDGVYTRAINDAHTSPVIDQSQLVEEIAPAVEGQLYTASLPDIMTVNSDDPYEYGKVAGPEWLTVSPAGILSGTPGVNDIGSHSLTVCVVDRQAGFAEKTYKLTVNNVFNGAKGMDDLLMLADQWLNEAPDSQGDVNQDGIVNLDDFGILTNLWQSGLSDSLYAYWALDDTYGSVLNGTNEDYVASTMNMSMYSWAHAGDDRGLYFDGTTDYVDVPGMVGVFGSNSRSCGAWIKTDQRTDGDIISWGTPRDGQQEFALTQTGGKLVLRVGEGLFRGKTTINDGQWHHVAVTWEPDSMAFLSNAKLYVDGRQEEDAVFQNNLLVNTSSEENVRLGVTWGGPFFKGSMRQAFIYNRVLTAAEIVDMSHTDRFIHLAMDETQGTVVDDVIGTYQGVLVNGDDASRVQGVSGMAVNLDGVDDYITIPAGLSNIHQTGVTISLWAKPTSTANWSRFIDFGNGAGGENLVWARQGTTGNLIFASLGPNGAYSELVAENAIATDYWQMFTITIAANGDAFMYKNGKLIASGTINIANARREDNLIGKSNFPEDSLYEGAIDDLRIYSKPLTKSEVVILYNSYAQ